mmetsp:Transcript_11445/g.26997  ORF Transcript_11445/g.26997 Transcript_11445/m.26997 type:complete len:113 (+) Transcript_11445:65-403(+)
MVKRDSAHLQSQHADVHQDLHPWKKFASHSPTPASPELCTTPEMKPSASPEARDHAHHSCLWQVPVKDLKAWLLALGADLKGVTEKTELVLLLEQLHPEFAEEIPQVPHFEL